MQWHAECRYEEYLNDVVDASEDFHEVSEIMSRHATLLATNKDLQQQQQRVTDLAEETRCGNCIAFPNEQVGSVQAFDVMLPLCFQALPSLLQCSEGLGAES